jgi:hypothetical protein
MHREKHFTEKNISRKTLRSERVLGRSQMFLVRVVHSKIVQLLVVHALLSLDYFNRYLRLAGVLEDKMAATWRPAATGSLTSLLPVLFTVALLLAGVHGEKKVGMQLGKPHKLLIADLEIIILNNAFECVFLTAALCGVHGRCRGLAIARRLTRHPPWIISLSNGQVRW